MGSLFICQESEGARSRCSQRHRGLGKEKVDPTHGLQTGSACRSKETKETRHCKNNLAGTRRPKSGAEFPRLDVFYKRTLKDIDLKRTDWGHWCESRITKKLNERDGGTNKLAQPKPRGEAPTAWGPLLMVRVGLSGSSGQKRGF